MIERTRVQGVVMGVGTASCGWSTCRGRADVKPGDLVVTSGIDGIYPKGFVIGTIESVDRGPGTYHEIGVRPAVDFSSLEEVLVVLTPPRVARPRRRGTSREAGGRAGGHRGRSGAADHPHGLSCGGRRRWTWC